MQHTMKSLWARRTWSQAGGIRVPVVVTLLLLVVGQVLGPYAWRQARKENARWLGAESPYDHDSPRADAPDVMLSRFSRTIADHSCEIDRPTVCDKTESPTSPALNAVNRGELPPASRSLLEQNGYSSADHLLVALLFNGQEAAVSGTLAALVRTGKLTSLAVHGFLYDWFLGPALVYFRQGRAEDAAALFRAFVENETAALNAGIRLSGLDDVDVTDLPSLFDAFCRDPDGEPGWVDPCAVPFLQAVGAGQQGGRFWNPMGDGIPNFLTSYRQAEGRSADLVTFLEMERWVGDPFTPIESWNPDTLPGPARYLGHFAKGRHFASTSDGGEACAQRREQALVEFRRASAESTPPYFVRAVRQALDELGRRHPCGGTGP